MTHTPYKVKQGALFTGGLTASGNLTITGCLQSGSAGADIYSILAGSVAASTPTINASNTGTASALVAGLTQNHKLFVSCSAVSGCLTMYNVYCAAASAALIANFFNSASENVAEDTGVVLSYIAIREG